jgi:hypothetical protein
MRLNMCQNKLLSAWSLQMLKRIKQLTTNVLKKLKPSKSCSKTHSSSLSKAPKLMANKKTIFFQVSLQNSKKLEIF